MHTETLLELNPSPEAGYESGSRNTLVQIPLSAIVEADLPVSEISNSDFQPLVDGEVRAVRVPCQYPACQSGGKVCTAQCS